MTTATRVYIARLAGIAVFDPNGDQIGRVRDVVTRQPSAGALSRVLGLVAEIPMGRRIFIPMGRVTAMDSDAVALSTGTVSMRRFAKRPGEALVLEELLDRKITLPHGPRGTVVDVAMERDRVGEWFLRKLAVREHTGRLSRRGPVRQLEWGEVPGLISAPEQGTEGLLATMDDMRPADVANVLQDLDDQRRNDIAAALDDERLADVLQELPEHDQVEILRALGKERAADVLEEMEPDDAADLLGELPQPDQAELLDLMEPDEAGSVRRLLNYLPGTAGSLMTSEPVVLTPDYTVADALARIREPQLPPAMAAQVYICRSPMQTPTGKYLGMAHFQALLREPPSGLVGAIVDNDIEPLSPETSTHEVTQRMATYNLVALPVVDDAGRLVGAVTVDDLIDHMLPADWRDRG